MLLPECGQCLLHGLELVLRRLYHSLVAGLLGRPAGLTGLDLALLLIEGGLGLTEPLPLLLEVALQLLDLRLVARARGLQLPRQLRPLRMDLGDVAALLVGLLLQRALQELNLLVKQCPLLVEFALQLKLLALELLDPFLEVLLRLPHRLCLVACGLAETLELGAQL